VIESCQYSVVVVELCRLAAVVFSQIAVAALVWWAAAHRRPLRHRRRFRPVSAGTFAESPQVYSVLVPPD